MSTTRLRHPTRQHTRRDRLGEEPARDVEAGSPRQTVRRVDHANSPTARHQRDRGHNAPLAVTANLLVIVLPALVVWALAPVGGPASLLGSVSLTVALSVATASLGSALWTRRMASGELVFSDLMVWGWVRRRRTERRLAEARDRLVLDSGGAGQSRLPADRELGALARLNELIDSLDPDTRGHSLRVTRHAEGIARAMHLPADELTALRTAAMLHDLGKIHTPRAILHKSARLSDEEFDVIKRHPGYGADMLAVLGDPVVEAMVRHHHERLDGSGYPDRLAGHKIPLGARIIAVADTFDAMTSDRSYRGAFEHRKALTVLASEAGTRLDAAAVSAFRAYYSGRRPAAWSALVTTATPRLLTWLGSGRQIVTAAAPTLGKTLPAIGAAALLAGPGGGPDVGGEGGVAGRHESSPADRIADTRPSVRLTPGSEPVPRSSREPARRDTARSDRLDDRVRSAFRVLGETNRAGAPPTQDARSVPRADPRGTTLPPETGPSEMAERDLIPTQPPLRPLPQASPVASPSVALPGVEPPAAVGQVIEPPIPPRVTPVDNAIASRVEPPATEAVAVSIPLPLAVGREGR